MFQLYLSCLLLMARAAPPLDTLDTRDREELGEVPINIETLTLGHVEELEDITKKYIEVSCPDLNPDHSHENQFQIIFCVTNMHFQVTCKSFKFSF